MRQDRVMEGIPTHCDLQFLVDTSCRSRVMSRIQFIVSKRARNKKNRQRSVPIRRHYTSTQSTY